MPSTSSSSVNQKKTEEAQEELNTVLNEIKDITLMNTELQVQLEVKRDQQYKQHIKAECTQLEQD